jgi:integrase
MNKVFLTDTEINNCCLTIRDRIIKEFPIYTEYIKFLYLYGCRINELFDYRITFDAIATKVNILPQKNNTLRVLEIKTAEVPDLIEKINFTNDAFYLNKRNLQRIIEKVNPYSSLWCGEKNIGAHIFRHNFVRNEILLGKQISTIDAEMGYTTQTIADTYLISRIYYKY